MWTPKGEINVGLKCGMMMGDYSRTAINTSVNSGTVIGVGCNIFGNGLTPKYIPSFSWGSEGVKRYEYKKALQERFENIKEHLLLNYHKVFLMRVNSPLDDKKSWLSSVAQALIGKSLETIRDEDENVLKDKFKTIIHPML